MKYSERIATMSPFQKAARMSLYGLGVALVVSADVEPAAAFESARAAIREICGHMFGGLGALLMTASGVGAVIAGAMGNMRASMSFIVVGIGAFTTDSMLSLNFEAASQECTSGGNGGAQPPGGQPPGGADPGGGDPGFGGDPPP